MTALAVVKSRATEVPSLAYSSRAFQSKVSAPLESVMPSEFTSIDRLPVVSLINSVESLVVVAAVKLPLVAKR